MKNLLFMILFALITNGYLAPPSAEAKESAIQQNTKEDDTTVIILATLHQFHLKFQFYSLDTLSSIIEKIKPDIICVELTAEDLRYKRDQAVKIEYSKCIIPVAEEKNYILVPMEPCEPEYSRIIKRYKQINKEIETKEPVKIEIFNQYTEALYDYLFSYWNSPADVNSSLTNALFEVKHNFQESLFGSTEKQIWAEWNTYFLNTILQAAEIYKGKKVLVTVGVEHVYWLKKHLKNKTKIKLIEVKEILNK